MARALLTSRDCKATPIPQGLVAWWFGTYDSVPEGYEIANGAAAANDSTYTRPNLLGRFLRSVDTLEDGAWVSSGAIAHGHSISSHSHTTGSENDRKSDLTSDGGDGHKSYIGHTHATGSASATLDNATPEPLHITAVPIVFTLPSGGTRGIVTNAAFATSALPPYKIIMAWHGNADSTPAVSAPAGWSKCDGNNGTPNLLGRYLRGIPTTGTNPGNTSGALTHTHDASHTHSTGIPSAENGVKAGGSTTAPSNGHGHTLLSAGGTTNAQNHEPSYITTHFVCFTGHGSGAAADAHGMLTAADLAANLTVPRGLAAVWTGTVATVPTGYGHCNGDGFANGNPTGYTVKPDCRARFVKHVATATTNSNLTATGSDTHTHSGGDHTHSITANNSVYGVSNDYSQTHVSKEHTHTQDAGTTYTNLTSDNKPPYYEVAWIIRD
jgi:hypothetical protein